ncbi:hypothetical protein [Roseovarius sp. THAF9]|uniref:hypothetical protein n=1 Tax=Roseovarius sp. THAF9 TaxID=2587847 RepID=UPI0012691E90|nr:hypothetical protein [Roseovarius sp. THAF9]
MAKPVNSFSSVAKAPRSWKSERVQKKLRATLSRIRKSKAAEPATADHPLDDVDYFCDDWIAICANEDCTHGVVDCDGVCAPF